MAPFSQPSPSKDERITPYTPAMINDPISPVAIQPFAVLDYLPIPGHRIHAPGQRGPRTSSDTQQGIEFRQAQRSADLLEGSIDQCPAGYRMTITTGFPRGFRITILPLFFAGHPHSLPGDSLTTYGPIDKYLARALKCAPHLPAHRAGPACPGGGIGRRAAFRSPCPYGCASSSLALGTNFS